MDDASRINNIRRSYPRYGVGRRDLAAPLVGRGDPKTTHVKPSARAWVESEPLPRWQAAIVIFSLSVLGWAGIIGAVSLVNGVVGG
jgi:hypothetical protein